MRFSANSLGAWPTAAVAVGMLRMLRREGVVERVMNTAWEHGLTVVGWLSKLCTLRGTEHAAPHKVLPCFIRQPLCAAHACLATHLTSRRPESRATTASRLMSRVHSNSWEAAADRMARSLDMAASPLWVDTSCKHGVEQGGWGISSEMLGTRRVQGLPGELRVSELRASTGLGCKPRGQAESCTGAPGWWCGAS